MTALDTNVLIYSCDKSDPVRQSRALDVITRVTDGVLLWQVACEFVSASRKLRRFGFTPNDAWDRLGDLLLLFPLVAPTEDVLPRARLLHLHHGWSFWDALVIAGCLEAGVSRLYSEDLPGESVPGLTIENPFT